MKSRARPQIGALWLPLLVLVLGLVLTAVLVRQTHRFIDQERAAEFEAMVLRMRNDLSIHTYRHVDVLRAYQAEFAVHQPVSPQAFDRITEVLQLQERFPAIESVGFELVETEAALGAQQREALHYARDTGDFAASAPIPVGALSDKQYTIKVYLPVYEYGMVPASRDSRRAHFLGAVFLELYPSRLVREVLLDGDRADIAARLLFNHYIGARNASGAEPQLVYDNQRQQMLTSQAIHRVVPLRLAGTEWSWKCHPTFPLINLRTGCPGSSWRRECCFPPCSQWRWAFCSAPGYAACWLHD